MATHAGSYARLGSVTSTTRSRTMLLTQHHAVIQGFADERVSLGVATGRVVRSPGEQVERESGVNTAHNLGRLPIGLPLEWQDDEQIDV